jgi:hypothetical protein
LISRSDHDKLTSSSEILQKDKFMSQISAKGFFLTKGGVVPTHHVIQYPDYFQKAHVGLPKKGITMTYGHRGPGNINRAALRKAKEEDLFLSFLDVKVDVGELKPNKQNFETLSTCRFLNLPMRASAEVMTDINQKWNEWLAIEGEPESQFPRRPNHRMDFLDKLVEHAPYNQLTAIAYDVETEVGYAKFMTIFDLSAIKKDTISVIPGGVTEIEFKLPI